jgi:hypothetical protein
MDVLEVGVAAGGEGAQKVERRRGLAVGVQLPARVGLARRGRELNVVDDVAAIGRQGDAIDRLRIGRAGLRELAGDAADLHDRRRGGERHHHCHLQEYAEEIADVVGRMFAEALGAIAALQQERIARRRLAKGLFELARFACKNQRRIAGKLALGLGQRGTIGIGRRLRDRLGTPAIRGPTLVQHDPWPWRAAERRFLKVMALYTVPRLRPICRFSRRAAFYGTGGRGRASSKVSASGPSLKRRRRSRPSRARIRPLPKARQRASTSARS